jgi:2',3'-cyclic-nucleotide 2'-phosphodiesterase (5'-nucleotidase family)
MSENEERTPPTIEELLANLAGDEKADPRVVELLKRFHDRINEQARRTIGQIRTGGMNQG